MDQVIEKDSCRILREGIFLIADPGLKDPNFAQTVILLCEHNDQGSLGVIVNRPTLLKVSEAIPNIKGSSAKSNFIYSGGPVQTHQVMTLCRTTEQIPDSKYVADGMYLGGTLLALEGILSSKTSEKAIRAYMGYAGWSSNQLEAELEESSWKVVPANQKFVFDIEPSEVWPTLLSSLGEKYGIYKTMPRDPSMN